MKVKIAELKAKLSQHIRYVRTSGDRIEVCIREEPVAYLTAVGGEEAIREAEVAARAKARLRDAGLSLVQTPVPRANLPKIHPSIAGDGQEDVNTVESIRKEKSW